MVTRVDARWPPWNRGLNGISPMGRRRVPPLKVLASGVPPRLPLRSLVLELRALLVPEGIDIGESRTDGTRRLRRDGGQRHRRRRLDSTRGTGRLPDRA